MVKVEFSLFSILRSIVGEKSVAVEIVGNTLSDALNEFTKRFGDTFKETTGEDMGESIKREFNIFVDGRLIQPREIDDYKVQDGSNITLLQPVGGG